MISVFDLNQYDEEGPDDFGEEPHEMMTCQRCGGTGICSDCIDDLCHGQECIHGDDSTYRECKGDGEVPCSADPVCPKCDGTGRYDCEDGGPTTCPMCASAPPSAPAMRRGEQP